MTRAKPDPTKEPHENQGPAEEVLPQSVLEALQNLTPDQLVTVSPEAEVAKGQTYRSAAWLHAPAQLELLAMAQKRLDKTAREAGVTSGRVEKVQAYLIKGTKLLVIKGAPVNDLTAISVNRYTGGSSAWINLISLLGSRGLTVETHWKERFEVAFIPKSSSLYPGLLIDLGQVKARERRSSKKGPEETA